MIPSWNGFNLLEEKTMTIRKDLTKNCLEWADDQISLHSINNARHLSIGAVDTWHTFGGQQGEEWRSAVILKMFVETEGWWTVFGPKNRPRWSSVCSAPEASSCHIMRCLDSLMDIRHVQTAWRGTYFSLSSLLLQSAVECLFVGVCGDTSEGIKK